jgi:hypothetical protein
MKVITTTESVRKADSSLEATLNPVALRSREIVSWAAAFTGSGQGRSGRSTERACRMSDSPLPSVTAKRTR